MRWQTTAILAVILVALATFYYVYEIRLGPEREKLAGRKGRVFTAEPGDVAAVEIRRGADTVKLARADGGGWQMLEPVKTRGDRGPVEETVTSVVTAKMDREVASSPGSLADFGLQTPAAEITLALKDGKQLALQVGAKNPTGVWVYAREKDKPSVFLLPEAVLRDVTRPVAEFRDKTVLSFDRTKVTGVEIVTREETLSVHTADGKWKLTAPVELPADSELMGEFLEKVGAARVKEFVTESPASLASFGLERPLRITINATDDKGPTAASVLLGRVDDAKKGVYAKRPDEPSVLLLPEEVWTALPKNVAALRNKTVVEYDRDKLARLEIESAKGPVTLVRADNRWRITAPEALAADQVEVGTLLRKLRDLKAQAFLTEDASGIARYLAKPDVRVTLTDEGGTAKTVLLATSPERRGGAPSAYAAVDGSGPVVLVAATALSEVGRSVTELRDRTLIGQLEPKDVKRMTVKARGKSAILERQGESDWRMIEPMKGSAKAAKVEDVLYMARGLKWREIVAAGGEEPGKYGLDTPELEITLARADGGEIATVMVGKRDGDRAFVRTRAAPTIYAIDARQLGETPNVPDDFKS